MANKAGDGPRTTVILPVFNAAGHLSRAAESVMKQSDDDLELIIVDDCSTDGSLAVARAVQATYSPDRITVIALAVNGGVSRARNAGLDAARGDWVSFIDSDDEYLPNYLETLFEAASSDPEVDVVVGGRIVVQNSGAEQAKSSRSLGIFDGPEACRLAMLDELTPFPWDKLIRRRLFDDVRFAEGAARFEDMTSNILLNSIARKVRSIDTPVYRYYIMDNSLTWGRIPTVSDTTLALDHLDKHLNPRFRQGRYGAAYACMRVLIMMLIAQSAIARGNGSPAAWQTISDCRRDIPLSMILSTIRVHRVIGLGAALLKFSPHLYAFLYRRHIRSSYGVG
ncbi:glycosyltransferase [Pseudarthrobacter sp. J75]|uniref:glycosyltransferase family 2 protein n=1 Tax=unclassified Pseudarthrobacter TaxID=2647000 RepID=UPI002E7FBB5E|nr:MULTISPECIES: glycosyltransferase [unclassified Pseudarthrobacter]MEE2521399.1 glycosyltransferase [Pseudarthrobacter sp. J47]MEE2528631.1 glycosyltransferase [Pseudarthrobacter sp. J75]